MGGGSRSAPSLRGSEFVPSVLGKLGEVGTLDGLGGKEGERAEGKKMTGSGRSRGPLGNRKSGEVGVFGF